tara:strand:+ start:148 stop:378 length:231 start_codon:yes stop_codon:yes gene_type:complete
MALDSDGERALREQTEHLMRLLHEKDKDHEHLLNVIHEKDKKIASLHDSLGYVRNKINNAVITLREIEYGGIDNDD